MSDEVARLRNWLDPKDSGSWAFFRDDVRAALDCLEAAERERDCACENVVNANDSMERLIERLESAESLLAIMLAEDIEDDCRLEIQKHKRRFRGCDE